MDKRLPVAVVMVVVGTVAMLLGIGPMVDVGTCASGGPYVVAQECPSDYDWLFWAIFAGFLVAFAGMLMVCVVSGVAGGFAVVSVWFMVLGAAALLKAPSLEGDSQLGLNIVGWVFIPMGVIFLLLAVLIHRGGRRASA